MAMLVCMHAGAKCCRMIELRRQPTMFLFSLSPYPAGTPSYYTCVHHQASGYGKIAVFVEATLPSTVVRFAFSVTHNTLEMDILSPIEQLPSELFSMLLDYVPELVCRLRKVSFHVYLSIHFAGQNDLCQGLTQIHF